MKSIKGVLSVSFVVLALITIYFFGSKSDLETSIVATKSDSSPGDNSALSKEQLDLEEILLIEANQTTRNTNSDKKTEVAPSGIGTSSKEVSDKKAKRVPPFREFEIVASLPEKFHKRIEMLKSEMKARGTHGSEHFELASTYNNLFQEEFFENKSPEYTKGEAREMFSMYMYHATFWCKYGDSRDACRRSLLSGLGIVKYISANDSLAWLNVVKEIRPSILKDDSGRQHLIAQMSDEEIELASYKFSNVIYYIDNIDVPFDEFILDYWARG